MKSLKPLLFTCAAALLSLSASANSTIFSESFDTAGSISSWVGGPTWDATVGNPGGAVIVSNDIQPTNKNYTLDIPLELTEDTDLTIEFDALSLINVAGTFFFYAEPEGFPQFFSEFNLEADINNSTYTPLEFLVENVPASATFITLRFEMITGAVLGSDISVAIDNLLVSGPFIDPPGTWKGYTLVDEFWADNVGQLGWVYVENDPWLWAESLNEWVYLPEGSVPGTSGVWYYMPPVE